jgi:hypothetical protein
MAASRTASSRRARKYGLASVVPSSWRINGEKAEGKRAILPGVADGCCWRWSGAEHR